MNSFTVSTDGWFVFALKKSAKVSRQHGEAEKIKLVEAAGKLVTQITMGNVSLWANKSPPTIYGRMLAEHSRGNMNMRMSNAQGRSFLPPAKKYAAGKALDFLVPIKGFSTVTKYEETQDIVIEKIPNEGEANEMNADLFCTKVMYLCNDSSSSNVLKRKPAKGKTDEHQLGSRPFDAGQEEA